MNMHIKTKHSSDKQTKIQSWERHQTASKQISICSVVRNSSYVQGEKKLAQEVRYSRLRTEKNRVLKPADTWHGYNKHGKNMFKLPRNESKILESLYLPCKIVRNKMISSLLRWTSIRLTIKLDFPIKRITTNLTKVLPQRIAVLT